MKASCNRSKLREGLRIVGGVVDPKNVKPILKDIRVRALDDCIELSATDLEVGIKFLVRGAEVQERGGIVVPVNPIEGIVNESREEFLSLTTEGGGLLVETKGSRFRVPGLQEDEFPEIPDFPEDNYIEIEGAVLREMVEKTIFAVALEKQRYALNGVLLVTKEKSAQIEMVATDGRRLAVIRRKANSTAPFGASAIVPMKALQEIQKLVGEEEIVKVYLDERRIILKTEHGVLVAQLVEGRFPSYRDVIPDDSDKKMEIAAHELAYAVRQAAVTTARDSRFVYMKVGDNMLVTESSSAEAGQAHVEIPVKYEGDPIELRFNPDFLLDGVKAMADETIRMEMKDSARAVVMRAAADYLYLVMPITQD